MRKSLLQWYEQQKRDLPWRRRGDAYAIWLSEVMLQQTRVTTVIPYYQRFLQRFPDVFALAEAPLDDVLSAWSGLGYYRRARLLHAGAVHVATQLGGEFPREARQLQQIPGIGAYTSGAIASIAFGARAPLVDGNVERVLCRLVADPLDPRRAGKKGVWQRAAQLLDPRAPGDFNQALMELGATVCTPKSPSCARCPWQRECQARAAGNPLEYPKLAAKVEQRPLALTYLVVVEQRTSRVLLMQRGAEGRFAGLWEPPCLEGEQPKTALGRARRLAKALGVAAPKDCGGFEHVLSHLRLRVSVYVAVVPRAPKVAPLPGYVALRVCRADDERGESRLARRALELALAHPSLRPGPAGD